MKLPGDFISRVLSLPYGKMVYELSQQVHSWAGGWAVLETEDYDFKVEQFAEYGGCEIKVVASTHGHSEVEWLDQRIVSRPVNAVLEVTWRGHTFSIIRVMADGNKRSLVVSETPQIGENFFEAVCRWSTEVRDSIIVAGANGFERDDDLRRQIQEISLEGLVLSNELRRELYVNFEEFFNSKETYAKYGIPWKRGVILHGPPGNGKTMVLKAMLNRLKVAVIYVRTLETDDWREQQTISLVYKRAREMAPCMVVMEDLDSLIDKENLSYLLNELDGFRPMEGVLTVATTNHLDKLDSAITDRPSRFDRKILFGLPEKPERVALLQKYVAMWDEEIKPTPREIDKIADIVNGFSMAYLKELCISSLSAWMVHQRPGHMAQTMRETADLLRKQMKNASD